MKTKLDKWLEWIDKIYKDCQSLVIKSYFYSEYLSIVKNNKSIASPPDFHEWIARNYYEAALMSIRRLLDNHKDAISLRNLLNEMMDNTNLISKKWYLDQIKDDKVLIEEAGLTTKSFAEDYFAETHTTNGEKLSPKLVRDDIRKLDQAGSKLSVFIDNTLAHKNKGPKGSMSIKTKNIEQAIKQVEEITIKYLELFGKGGYDSLCPTWQYDWQVIFTKPWIKKNG